jgi:hypothetical protein
VRHGETATGGIGGLIAGAAGNIAGAAGDQLSGISTAGTSYQGSSLHCWKITTKDLRTLYIEELPTHIGNSIGENFRRYASPGTSNKQHLFAFSYYSASEAARKKTLEEAEGVGSGREGGSVGGSSREGGMGMDCRNSTYFCTN